MRLQTKLIKEILEYIEVNDTNRDWIPVPELRDYRNCEVDYHILLCEEEGYFKVNSPKSEKNKPILIGFMTMRGHKKLEELRRP